MSSSIKAIALGAIISVGATLSAGAATIFDDRASFDAATGGSLDLETFDNAIARDAFITFDGGITSSRSGTTNSPNEVAINPITGDGSFAGLVTRTQSNLITFDFGTSINAFGADFSGLGSLWADLVGTDGSITETVTIASSFQPGGFFGFISDSPFSELTFRTREGSFGSQAFNLDDLSSGTVAPSPIPVPASLPLLLAAFGGIGFMRRRKSA